MVSTDSAKESEDDDDDDALSHLFPMRTPKHERKDTRKQKKENAAREDEKPNLFMHSKHPFFRMLLVFPSPSLGARALVFDLIICSCVIF